MVKIYTTPTCVFCRMAKEYFNKNGVQYEEANVLTDLAARKEMFDKSHQMGVPVIDVNGKIIVGFDQDTVDGALNLKK
ncbi:MAG: NrdH-redoxin [Patescibacteria group bacterium]|nr:NrdH-redoxin [Patescibacteria group bacterium]